MTSVNPELGTNSCSMSESESCLCRATVEPNQNYVRHGRSTTSEVGLTVSYRIGLCYRVVGDKELEYIA